MNYSISMSPQEKSLIEELRSSFLKLSSPVENSSQSEKQWMDNINRLKTLVISDDPRIFLQWDVITRTMVVGNADFIDIELNFLRNLPDWNRWEKAINEVPVGQPTLFPKYPSSSGNLIHHAYHVAQFEKKTGTNIETIDTIFEFGGGYGSMYRLMHNLGFQGKYIIFDFPAFSALQQFFIKSIGLEVHTIDSYKSAKSGVICISDLDQLELVLTSQISSDNSMFLASWSISETPIEFRESILSLITQFKAFLIAYQGQFDNNNNIEFFEKWKNDQDAIEWHNFKIEHIPNNYYHDNYYLIGHRPL